MNIPNNDIYILILAAGSSSRMGQAKQLLAWNNTTLLNHAIQTAKNTGVTKIKVILGAKAARIRKSITDAEVDIIINTKWSNGLGSSIACGVKAICKENKKTEAILVMLADQPLVHSSFLNQLIGKWKSSKSIVATAYEHGAGVPALFGTAYFSELSLLNKDFGAKALMAQNAANMASLTVEGSTIDIDTISDYNNLLNI